VQFYKPKTEKTEPSPNQKNRPRPKKQSQTEKTKSNWFEPVFILKTKPKLLGLNWFRFGFLLK